MMKHHKDGLVALICLLLVAHVVRGQSSKPNPDCGREHFERAQLHEAADDPRAEQEFRNAIGECRDVYPEAWLELSSYLAGKQRFDEAVNAWRKYLAQSDKKTRQTNPERLRRLKRVAELKSRNDRGDTVSVEEMIELVHLVDGFASRGDAVPYAEKAVKLYPESTTALVVLANLLKSTQKDRALELLNRAVSFAPTDPSLYVTRGGCYFWSFGDPIKAEADFRRALELSNESNASAWAGLGDSLARMGQRAEAIAAYQKYLSKRPKSAEQYDGEIRKSIELLRRNSE